MRHGRECEVFDRLKLRRFVLTKSEFCFCARALDMKSRQCRMKDYGRLGIEWDIDLTHGFVIIQIVIDAALRHCFLRVRQFNPNQLLSVVHHLFGDP